MDILAHFNLKAYLRGESPPFSAAQLRDICAVSAETGKELGRAEADITKYWAAEYLRQHGDSSFDATVLGWFRQELNLAVILLDASGIESIVRVDFPVAAGDKVSVAVNDVDVKQGYFRLGVVGILSSSPSETSDHHDDEEDGGVGGAAADEGLWEQSGKQLSDEEELPARAEDSKHAGQPYTAVC